MKWLRRQIELFRRRRPRGQATTELVVILWFGILFVGAIMYFFPDSMNALQIHMDGFYYMFAMPIP
jgi:hypothetical protein